MPIGRRFPFRCALAVLAAAAVPCALAAMIEGQVFDRQGTPLAGTPVHVIERLPPPIIPALGTPAGDQEISRVVTDAHGFFTVDLGPRSIRGQVIVRCYDPQHWDAQRYAPPIDKDVSAALRSRERAIVACVVEDAPGWAALAHEIQRVGGPGTDRGRILRKLGLPPATVALTDGQVEWRYRGVTYVFRDGALAETRQTESAPAATPARTQAGPGEAAK